VSNQSRSASRSPKKRVADARRVGKWAKSLLDLEALLGTDRWRRRMQQLIGGATRSPYQAKIVEDYHWVEVELALQLDSFRQRGHISMGDVSLRTAAALDFACGAVNLQQKLNERGRRILLGRLRDGLNNGFAGLFLEIDTAVQLVEGGYQVRYPDFNGSGGHDLDAIRDNVSIAIECKSISTDAGRKIHRRDFYRFMDLLQPGGTPPTSVTSSVAVVVTMTDRFPADRPGQDQIASHVRELFQAGPDTCRSGDGYSVNTERFDSVDLTTATSNLKAATLRGRWGENSHIAGVNIEGMWNLVVVRSTREDDSSREALAARRKAAKQLPIHRPGIIALQYEEITVQDLRKPAFRRRLAILDAAIYRDERAAHVVGVYHCAFDGRWPHAGQLGKPAVATWRSPRHGALMPKALGTSVDDAQFARLLNPFEGTDYGV
jgi:hypothetical protein